MTLDFQNTQTKIKCTMGCNETDTGKARNTKLKHTHTQKVQKKKETGVKEVCWRHQQLQLKKQLKIKAFFVDFYKPCNNTTNTINTINKRKNVTP